MSPGATFARVYLALKQELTSGCFAPGDHLEPAAIGERFNSSVTPVRDALHRLVGERLVEAVRHDGFRVPAPTETDLRDLYAWNEILIALALRRWLRPNGLGASRQASSTLEAKGPGEWTAASLFRDIATRSGLPELIAAVDNLNDRLGAARAAEAVHFEDIDHELTGLVAQTANSDLKLLHHALRAYHRRRQRSVPQLLMTARRMAETR